MTTLQQGEYYETLAALSYLKEYSELFEERYQKALEVAYDYVRDSQPRMLSWAELYDVLYDETTDSLLDAIPVWVDGKDNHGRLINCYSVLVENCAKENGYSGVKCFQFGSDQWQEVDLDNYGKTWVVWNKRPSDEQIGKYLKGKDK